MNHDNHLYEGPWQQWFAWYPVRVDGRWKWFERVLRRRCERSDYLWDLVDVWYEYQ